MQNGNMFEKMMEDLFSYTEDDIGIQIGTMGKTNNMNEAVSFVAIDCPDIMKMQEKLQVLQFLCSDNSPENGIKSLFTQPPYLTGRTKGLSFEFERKDDTTYIRYQSKSMINGNPVMYSESTVQHDEEEYKEFKAHVEKKGGLVLILALKNNLTPVVFLTIDETTFAEKI